ncbi:MAG: lysophospholipase [Rhodobacteraceae bacterium]|nr:MAG: lysophospholipase [Paracoccaceae bacterium]
MSESINLIKLCVGAESVESQIAWQATTRALTTDGLPRHITRMWPKRADELLNGGSLYWVIKGQVQCRQRIVRLDEVIGNDGIRRCGIVFEPEIIRTQSALRRPFQGWRYLRPEDAPPDLPMARSSEDTLPDDLNRALAEIGVL